MTDRAITAIKAFAVCLMVTSAALPTEQGPLAAAALPSRPSLTPCVIFAAGYYGIAANNILFSFIEGETRARQVSGITGNLVALDFRPSDAVGRQLYGLTDTGQIYRFPVDPFGSEPPQLVNTLPTTLANQPVMMDFDPTGAGDLHVIAGIESMEVRDGAQPLDTIVGHKVMGFATDDRNARVLPRLAAGAYNNNLRGAQFSRLYVIDYELDVLAYEAYPSAGGKDELRTIGPIMDSTGRAIDFAANAGFDIYTQLAFPNNTAVAVTGRDIYCIHNVGVFDQTVPQVYRATIIGELMEGPIHPLITGDLIDVAVIPTP